MIRGLRSFGAFWYDFIVGDDWWVAVGVVLSLAATWALSASTSLAVWWLVPVAVIVLLPLSLYRLTRANRR
ncbi:MAG: hypothetical protein JWN20_361 [Jatrophihabitantaceae bacterium]|nr:hypothetical protein [Jatrophihabitantaceae bacterium]